MVADFKFCCGCAEGSKGVPARLQRVFDVYEQQVERRLQRWHVRLMCRLHPELLSIGDEKDRAWAFWYAAAGKSSTQRWITGVCTLLVGPAVVAGAVLVLGGKLGWTWHVHWLFLATGGALAGAIVTAVSAETVRGSSIRVRYFRAMRIAGHDICGACGYVMTGHKVCGQQPRVCPECGASVPPPRSQLRAADGVVVSTDSSQQFRKAS